MASPLEVQRQLRAQVVVVVVNLLSNHQMCFRQFQDATTRTVPFEAELIREHIERIQQTRQFQNETIRRIFFEAELIREHIERIQQTRQFQNETIRRVSLEAALMRENLETLQHARHPETDDLRRRVLLEVAAGGEDIERNQQTRDDGFMPLSDGPIRSEAAVTREHRSRDHQTRYLQDDDLVRSLEAAAIRENLLQIQESRSQGLSQRSEDDDVYQERKE